MTTGGVEVPSSGNEPVSVRSRCCRSSRRISMSKPSITLGLTTTRRIRSCRSTPGSRFEQAPWARTG